MKAMTNLLKVSLPLVLFTLLCLNPVALFAESREEIKEKIVKDLGLTEEQQAKFSEHRKNTDARHKELKQALRKSEKELREELAKYNADQANIQALAATVKNTQAQMLDARIKDITALKSILTQEQFEKLQQKAKARAENMKAKREGLKKAFMEHE